MQIIRNFESRLSTMGEVFRLFVHNKWWWIVPMLAMLLLIGSFILLAEGSVIAPFVYTLF